MSDQKNGAGGSQNGNQGGAGEKEFKPFTEADVEAAFAAGDVDKLKEIATQSVNSIPGLYRRAKDAEEKLEKAGPKAPENQNGNQTTPPATEVKRPQDHADYNDLRFAGYNEEEAAFIIKNGGKAALNDDFVKSAIEKARADKKAKEDSANGTPAQSGRSPIFQNKTEAELRAMSSKDLEKLLPHSDQ